MLLIMTMLNTDVDDAGDNDKDNYDDIENTDSDDASRRRKCWKLRCSLCIPAHAPSCTFKAKKYRCNAEIFQITDDINHDDDGDDNVNETILKTTVIRMMMTIIETATT